MTARPRDPRPLTKRTDSAWRPWGRLDITPRPIAIAQGGATVRLVVYPPGLDRGRAALLNGWGMLTSWWGLFLGAAAFVVVTLALEFARPWNAAVVPAIYVALLAWLFTQTRDDRARSRQVEWRFSAARARAGLVSAPPPTLSETLALLDPLERGAVDPVTYQRVWQDSYAAMPSPTPR